jgi:hypothetical protein
MKNAVCFAALVAVVVVGRLMPHWPNFTPVAASALFAGFFFRNRLLAAAVPVVAMLISDRLIGGYETRVMIAVYASLLAPVLFGALLQRRFSAIALVGSSLTASVLFFLTTNFAVWNSGHWYAHTAHGLMLCYTAGLPFFRYTLGGDLFFSAALFGAFALLKRAATLLDRPLVAAA